MKTETKLAKAATIIILIALIRTIAEPLRLHYYGSDTGFHQMKPFLIAALIAAASLLAMIIAYYYCKYKMCIAIAALVIISMVVIKYQYL